MDPHAKPDVAPTSRREHSSRPSRTIKGKPIFSPLIALNRLPSTRIYPHSTIVSPRKVGPPRSLSSTLHPTPANSQHSTPPLMDSSLNYISTQLARTRPRASQPPSRRESHAVSRAKSPPLPNPSLTSRSKTSANRQAWHPHVAQADPRAKKCCWVEGRGTAPTPPLPVPQQKVCLPETKNVHSCMYENRVRSRSHLCKKESNKSTHVIKNKGEEEASPLFLSLPNPHRSLRSQEARA